MDPAKQLVRPPRFKLIATLRPPRCSHKPSCSVPSALAVFFLCIRRRDAAFRPPLATAELANLFLAFAASLRPPTGGSRSTARPTDLRAHPLPLLQPHQHMRSRRTMDRKMISLSRAANKLSGEGDDKDDNHDYDDEMTRIALESLRQRRRSGTTGNVRKICCLFNLTMAQTSLLISQGGFNHLSAVSLLGHCAGCRRVVAPFPGG